ncbi:radical SAM protein [Nitratidesulfovibrio sp.]|uniref:radical SAM protein n=1 Tax=Nitratidesulfovibrio sp. TaxID=2802297 RepID=UPI0033413EA9
MSAGDSRHPCFTAGAHATHARIHLPVAAACNIRCGYCDRRHDCVNESRPGVTSRVLNPAEAAQLVDRAVAALPHLSVVGIAGPGDPLADPGPTLETLALVRRAHPGLLLCLSTNGLALPEHVDALAALGVGHVTVTLNAVDPELGARLYAHVTADDGRALHGAEGAAHLLARQEEGLARLARAGIAVKVNTVVVPGVNDAHVEAVARRAAALGASLMNCIGLIPVASTPLGGVNAPGPQMMDAVRAAAGRHLPQMRHCARCRADAAGLLGDGGTLGGLGLLPPNTDTPRREHDLPGLPGISDRAGMPGCTGRRRCG